MRIFVYTYRPISAYLHTRLAYIELRRNVILYMRLENQIWVKCKYYVALDCERAHYEITRKQADILGLYSVSSVGLLCCAPNSRVVLFEMSFNRVGQYRL